MYDGKGEVNGRTVAQMETGMEIPPPSVEVDVLRERIAALEAENARLRAFAESIPGLVTKNGISRCKSCRSFTSFEGTERHIKDCLYLRAQAALKEAGND